MRQIEELFLSRWFAYEATFGIFATDKRTAFNRYAEVYGIMDDNVLDKLFGLTQAKTVCLAKNFTRCETVLRLLDLQDFKATGANKVIISDAEYSALAIKHRSLQAIEQIKYDRGTVSTISTLIDIMQAAAKVGNILAAGLLSYALYSGCSVQTNKKYAEEFVLKCLREDDADGTLIALHFGSKALQGRALWVLKGIAEKSLAGNPYCPILESYKDIAPIEVGGYIRT